MTWRIIIRFVVVESKKVVGVFPFFLFEHRKVASLFFFERSQTRERVGKILLNYIFYKRVYDDDVNDDVNESDDKNDGRQTKCVYLLFRFFFFTFFFFFSSFKSENKRTSY